MNLVGIALEKAWSERIPAFRVEQMMEDFDNAHAFRRFGPDLDRNEEKQRDGESQNHGFMLHGGDQLPSPRRG